MQMLGFFRNLSRVYQTFKEKKVLNAIFLAHWKFCIFQVYLGI